MLRSFDLDECWLLTCDLFAVANLVLLGFVVKITDKPRTGSTFPHMQHLMAIFQVNLGHSRSLAIQITHVTFYLRSTVTKSLWCTFQNTVCCHHKSQFFTVGCHLDTVHLITAQIAGRLRLDAVEQPAKSQLETYAHTGLTSLTEKVSVRPATHQPPAEPLRLDPSSESATVSASAIHFNRVCGTLCYCYSELRLLAIYKLVRHKSELI